MAITLRDMSFTYDDIVLLLSWLLDSALRSGGSTNILKQNKSHTQVM